MALSHPSWERSLGTLMSPPTRTSPEQLPWGRKDWTKEPVEAGSSPSARSPSSNWADFTVFSKDSQEDTSPQDMDLEPVLEPSDIDLTYVSPETGQKREIQQQQEQQQDESPQRHSTQLYNPLVSPGISTDQQQSPQAKDTSQVPISHSIYHLMVLMFTFLTLPLFH